MFDLSKRVAVVTGGSGGIGSALARGLARQGATVAVASRTVEGLEDVAREIREETGATVEPSR